jgi:hypothetical protein
MKKKNCATKKTTAIGALGGSLPVPVEELARRAYEYTMRPGRNPLKAIMDRFATVEETPPLLGIFNDIPWYQFRENEAHAWARAGFSWIVNDGEHPQWEGYYGRDQNAAELRLGLLAVQRLPRDAGSAFGDAYVLGARATMRPYGTVFEEADRYLRSVDFPVPGKATPYDRGGYPTRGGDRVLRFTPGELRDSETETQAWVQFETVEYIMDEKLRDSVLDRMAARGRNRTCGFIGPFDAIMRGGDNPEMRNAINSLLRAGAKRGIGMGRVVGSGSMTDPGDIEDGMVEAIENGCRLVCVHPVCSDIPYHGAVALAAPFFKACARCGF